ncbi:Rrf2 family transcriptional regulator [Gordonia sp. ABSL1-1]|uniref:RrF2 family transcriptional regulator n=1 Tax=Gordonia sp. ABSL1-1 TaxID=3053923 RepID=UPI0025726AE3|nr:Rrf2 family transcriptional regulator [Gordonia sp. ABSL1-1]MDL9938529.1 Rrf2 family transcriptional regulator [Gordonia sp. ABSL1-1]
MQLTRFTDIGLRVVMRLAIGAPAAQASTDLTPQVPIQPTPTQLTTRLLAAELSVPLTHVAKVVSRLSELGVVHSRRGRTGGLVITELGRTAQIGWLAEALEGDGEVVDCEGPQPCPLRGACRLRGALTRARAAFFASLDDMTVADLVLEPTAGVLLTLSPPAAATARGITRLAE